MNASEKGDVAMLERGISCPAKRCSFGLFKSNVCHRLKALGDIAFLIEVLESNAIRDYFNKGWYPESLYLLAMVDYLYRINSIATCKDYDDIRKRKLADKLYPAGIIALTASQGSEAPMQQVLQEAIPEFLRFNIVEIEISDVI